MILDLHRVSGGNHTRAPSEGDILIKLQAVDTIRVPVQIHRPRLALLPALVQLRLDPVNVLPVVGRPDRRHAQASARLDRPARGVCRPLLPEERLAPDVLVLDDAVPPR